MEFERTEAVVPADIQQLKLHLIVEAALHEVDVIADEEFRPDWHVWNNREREGHMVAVEFLRNQL